MKKLDSTVLSIVKIVLDINKFVKGRYGDYFGLTGHDVNKSELFALKSKVVNALEPLYREGFYYNEKETSMNVSLNPISVATLDIVYSPREEMLDELDGEAIAVSISWMYNDALDVAVVWVNTFDTRMDL